MTTGALDDYLARLADLLPAAEASRIVEEVREMILDRAEAIAAEQPDLDAAGAEAQAVAAWDSPEALADQLSGASLTIGQATRRTFWRSLWMLFAGHLALAIVLTVAGGDAATVPGFVGPLPTTTWIATVLGVLSVFCIDLGALLLIFMLLLRPRSGRRLPRIGGERRWSRRDGVKGLFLMVLLAVIFNLFLDSIFALRHQDALEPFLGQDLKSLLPWLNVVLGLFAARYLLIALGRADSPATGVANTLASLGAAVLAILAATRSDLVVLPEGGLTADARDVLEDVMERVFLLVFVVAALFLAVRFVKSAMRTGRLLRG